MNIECACSKSHVLTVDLGEAFIDPMLSKCSLLVHS